MRVETDIASSPIYADTVRRSAITAVAVLVMAVSLAAPAAADESPAPTEATTPPVASDTAPPAPDPTPDGQPTPDPVTPEAPAPPQPPSAEPAAPTAPAAPPTARIPLRLGAIGWRVAKVQERLAWLGYSIYPGNIDRRKYGESTSAAVRRFQAKFGLRPNGVVGQRTWDRLATVVGRVGRLPSGCLGERTICIDKSQRLVRLVEKGKVRITMDARFGFTGAETNEGTFRVHLKSRDHTSSLYRTWMPFALFFSGGQAVHYSPYFARDGYAGASHGCVNLRDYKGAQWLFDHASVGTRVYVYRT